MSETGKAQGGSEAAAEIEKLRSDLASVKQDLARLLKTLAAEAKGGASEEAQRLYATLSEQSERSTKALRQEMEERPLITLLLAFGIGFIGGSLLRR
jgi:F0F1-type ATP synthase membrane subunit b/b'